MFMNGFAVYEAMEGMPPESLALEPCPGRAVADYFTARKASKALELEPGNLEANVHTLVPYIFERHPFVLDLSSALTHRYIQARNFMGQYPDGLELLACGLQNNFSNVHDRLMAGYVAMRTSTVLSPDPNLPKPETVNGWGTIRLAIPPIIQERSLAWNEWAQSKIDQGEVDDLFTGEISRHGVKVANGDLLPAGNLWVEVGEGLARIRSKLHSNLDAEARLGITWDESLDENGLSQWFIMSHIAERGILELSQTIRPGMIDGMRLTPEVYARSYSPIVELIDLNPAIDIKGILSDGSWIYSNELDSKFPNQHVAQLHDIAGTVVELGPADAIGLGIQTKFATLNPARREAYEQGTYKAGVAARFIDRDGMVAVLEKLGIPAPER
jgi:hypothetical protein